MGKIVCVPLILALAACGGTPAEHSAGPSPTSAPATRTSEGASPTATPTKPDPTPAGHFVRVLGIMDCPGGCPSSSVSEALTEAGADVDPILVDGFLVVDDDGSVLFCEGLTDEVTPACEGERLAFEGQGAFELLAGAQWSDEVQLLGTVHPAR
jgi:hypothetical protein